MQRSKYTDLIFINPVKASFYVKICNFFDFPILYGRDILIAVLCCTLLATGCISGEEKIRENLVLQVLELRRNEFMSEQLAACRKEVVIRAEAFADSLIAEEISFRLSDSIIFPEKPIKPEFIGPIIISDTAVARPIF
jgi:hypothetical protein